MIKSKLSITNFSLIFTSLLSVSLIIVSFVYSHQLSVLKRGYQIQSENLQRCQKNIIYQDCYTNQQDCPKQDCDDYPKQDCPECQLPTCDTLQCVTKDSCKDVIDLSDCQGWYKDDCQICQKCPDCECENCKECDTCPTPIKSSNLFLLEGTYNDQPYQKVIKFQIASSDNTGYTIKEVCTEQDQICGYTPNNIITLNADGELELTTDDTVTKLSSDATSESLTWTTTTWGMPWTKNAIKVNLPVYASESDVLLQKDIQKIKSLLSVVQIEVEEEIGSVQSSSIQTVTSSSIGTVNSDSTSYINVDAITQITSNTITNITINNDETVTKKETAGNNEPVLDGIRQLSSSENGITYISSPKINNISSTTIERINTNQALSIKLNKVITGTTETAIEITEDVTGYIKIGGNINCAGETEACVNLGNINNNANDGYALSVSGNVKSTVLFSENSTLSNIVNKGTITNGITNDNGTIGDITNQADSTLSSIVNSGKMGSVSNSGSMSSFTNSGTLNESIINKGTANNMKNEGGTLTNGLQINGGTIGTTSTKYGLSINGVTTIQGSDVGILIGNDSKDNINIQTSGGVYGILMQQATIGHIGLYRGINIDRRESYCTGSPWVNIYSKSDKDSYAIFVGSNNVILYSSTGESTTDTHTYYHMEPQIHSKGYWGAVTQGNHYTCTASKDD